MAKRSKTEVNKSAAIRDYATANPKAKPKQIVEALAAQGIEVSAAFVSTLRSNDKRKGGKKRKGSVGRPRMAGVSAASSASAIGGVDVQVLAQAKKLVDQMGSVADARKALDVLAKILNPK